MVTFDGTTKIISIDLGVTELDIKELYSDWKEWLQVSDNAKYLHAFRTAGGDPLTSVKNISPYYFLLNGWRIRPQEAEHVLDVDGFIVVDGGGNPFIPPLGTYNVMINITTSANSFLMEGGGAGGTDWTTSEKRQIRDALGVDGSKTASTGGLLQKIKNLFYV